MSKQSSINPATGDVVFEVEEHTDAELEARVAAAADAATAWGRAPFADRAAVLVRAAEIIEKERESFGQVMTQEMGKTLVSAIAEADKCAGALRYYAEHGASFLAPDVVVEAQGERGQVWYQPLGTVLAIMPWNFPFWQVIRFAAPALAAGNTGLLKHASNVPRCAIALEDLFHRAGAPHGVFQSLLIGSRRVAGLIGDDRVHAVTLTGSEPAGRSVAETAGRHLKKAVLELGGSDPFIVCKSADIERASTVAVQARCINNGQSCIAAKRFIVVDDVADAFIDRFTSKMRALKVGDPMEAATELGPLATRSIRDELHQQVTDSVAAGARLTAGGAPLDGPGNFYAPSILTDIPKAAPAWGEELFGPVALVHRVPSLDAALDLANGTRFGLGGSVWTTDAREAEYAASRVDSGSVFVNGMVASDQRFPFGGVKASGYGRELGVWGLREFVNVKTVRIFGL